MSKENQEFEFLSDAQELDDADLEEVSGGGCGNGSGCCDGVVSSEEEEERIQ